MSKRKNTMALRRNELLLDVEQSIHTAAVELGTEKIVAEHLGAAIADMLLERWGGQNLTFPMNGYYGLSPREVAIVERRDQGDRIYEIAREFRMTERGVRKLLARVGAGRTKTSAQQDMFGQRSR